MFVLTKRPTQATPIYTSLSQDKVVGTTAKLRMAALTLSDKKSDEALKDLDQVLSAEPQNAQALLLKARYLMALDKPDEALVQCEAAVKANPQSAEAQYMRGLVLMMKNESGRAMAYTPRSRGRLGRPSDSLCRSCRR